MAEPDTRPLPGATPAPDVLLTMADAGEDAREYDALRRSLHEHHRPVGPVEVALVDRIVALTWRSRRVARAERGLSTLEVLAAAKDRQTTLEDYDMDELLDPDFGPRDVLASADLEEVAKAFAVVQGFRTTLEEGPVEDPEEMVETLDRVLGRDDAQARLPEVEAVALAFTQPPAAPRRGRKRANDVPPADATRDAVGEALCAVEARLRDARDLAQARERVVRAVRVEANLVPEADHLDALSRYETHLDKCLERATQALRREQARRRLREALPRLGRYGTGP